jgi:hypothetical protein
VRCWGKMQAQQPHHPVASAGAAGRLRMPG